MISKRNWTTIKEYEEIRFDFFEEKETQSFFMDDFLSRYSLRDNPCLLSIIPVS